MSKLLLFDFECPTHGVFEELVKSDIKQIPCPQCNASSERQIPVPHVDHMRMALFESASPETLRYYERVRRERKAIEEKSMRDHGDYGVPPGAD